MESAQELLKLIFNAALIVMIMATMFGAGLSTTLSALGGVFRNVKLLILVLLAALIVRPLVGWGTAAVLSLATPAFIAILLLAACPGAPFGAKLVMTSHTGHWMQWERAELFNRLVTDFLSPDSPLAMS